MRVSISVVVLLLSACSGGNSDQFGPECGSNSSCAPPEILPAESIIGLWNSSTDIESAMDIRYSEIKVNGEYIVYNYQQDEIGSGENCYIQSVGRIWRYSESSNYQLEFTDGQSSTQRPATIYRDGVNLYVALESHSEELWSEVQGESSSDFVLCQ